MRIMATAFMVIVLSTLSLRGSGAGVSTTYGASAPSKSNLHQSEVYQSKELSHEAGPCLLTDSVHIDQAKKHYLYENDQSKEPKSTTYLQSHHTMQRILLESRQHFTTTASVPSTTVP